MLRVCLRCGVAGRALKDGVVIRVRVAGRANAVGVSVVHREPRVIESCVEPVRCNPRRVAGRAGRREAGRGMVRIRRPVVVSRVAGVAIGRRSSKDAVNVAQIARHRRVCALQWERRAVVIERGTEPTRRRVAHRAVGRVASRDVVRDAPA